MSDYKVVPVDVREALKAMYDAAHPAYVADEHFRDKLIQAREKARAVLESAPAPSGEAVELVDKLMYAAAHAANSLGAAYRVNRRAADEARAALFAAITHPPAERGAEDGARLDWLEQAATVRKVELAKSLYGTGFEIGEWPSMRVTVRKGSLRDAIDAARGAE